MSSLYLGTIGWSYDFWKGKFYPAKTPSKSFLSYYSTHFNTVEVDSTFYRIPTIQTIKNWKQQTPSSFMFALKFPQIITHVKTLKDCQNETRVFLDKAGLLGEKLGPLLLQFPPSFGVDRFSDLKDYLTKLPATNRYVVEVRDPAWLNEEFYSALSALKVALAWVDSPIMPQNLKITADFLYIRWEGDRRKVNGTLGKTEVDKAGELRVWAKKIKPLLAEMAVFGYFGKYYSGFPPQDIVSLQGSLVSD